MFKEMMSSTTYKLCFGGRFVLFTPSCRNLSLESIHFQDLHTSESLEFEDPDEIAKRIKAVQNKRNKSRLKEEHYNIMHQKANSMSALLQSVSSLRTVRETFGKYGTSSNINPKYLWPSRQEMCLLKEYEQLLFPEPVSKMIEKVNTDRERKVQFILEGQEVIRKNLETADIKLREHKQLKIKQQNEELLAQQKRNDLIEEVRLIYGMRLSPNDAKFQEIVAQKEEEEKKAQKALKKQRKQEKILENLRRMTEEVKSQAETSAVAQVTDCEEGKNEKGKLEVVSKQVSDEGIDAKQRNEPSS